MNARARRRLWVVNQYYSPDVAATAQLLADLAEDAAAAGWDVRAVAGTAPYARPGRRSSARSRRAPPRHERLRGVRVRRLATLPQGQGMAQRAASYVGFLGAALLHLLRVRRGDTVLVLSTPPLLALVGWMAKARGARFIYKVEDLYPDVAVALGTLRPGWASARLAALSARLLSAADAVVVLDEAMQRKVVERRGRAEGVQVIPNWADGEAVRPCAPGQSRLRARLGLLEGTLVVGYAGNLGRAHRFDALLAAVEQAAREGLPVHLLVVGRGAAEAEVRAAAARCPNVTLLPPVPRGDLADLLAAADVHVVSLKPEVDGMVFPSKLAGVLAAGRPVLALAGAGTGLAAEVAASGAGWCVPHEPTAVLALLREIVRDAQAREGKGVQARAWFEARHARVVHRERWLALLAQPLAGHETR